MLIKGFYKYYISIILKQTPLFFMLKTYEIDKKGQNVKTSKQIEYADLTIKSYSNQGIFHNI